ncbi:MAG: 30S ribosomal protein S11 [Patescibacteria group bacterium]
MSRKKRLQKKVEKGRKAEAKRQAYNSKAAQKIKKKKVKRTVTEGKVYIQSTFNNTIVTITDTNGAVIATGSAGREGFKGSKKSTSFAASKAANTAVAKATGMGLAKAEIFVKGVGTGRDSAIRSVASAGIDVVAIKDVTPVPHNGPRARKARRV